VRRVVADSIAWLCRTPRRLAVAAVVVLAVLLLGGTALGGSTGTAADGSDGGGAGAGSGGGPAATTPARVPDADPYVRAAVTFAERWAVPEKGATTAQWQKRLAPLATDDLAEALTSVDITGLPGVPPEGEPVVRYLASTSALIAVPLADSTTVLVTVVGTGAPLQVSDIQPDVGD
jgi:hypothetical protein